ncbi:MAG: 50S ribosomal protein L3 N(5)-glutamine methyltransferase [Gammaproteobacteria bacterium]|nr:50S ribosomal protein L3 N(5)-glutamine methyltransferase [Gammaproteobacteria bacterium]
MPSGAGLPEVLHSQADTVADLLSWGEAELAAAGIICAQGTQEPRDEAAAIIYHLLGLDHADQAAYGRKLSQVERERCEAAISRRISERIPAAYLLGEAWFAGRPYFVDRHVLIPRSPFASLIESRFEPWLVAPGPRLRILEIGTGSGCIAIGCALAFPQSFVVATDVSRKALAVARRNVERHRVGQRVVLLNANLLHGIRGRFDLIVSNPPYVPESQLHDMPAEFRWEPFDALSGGPDGLLAIEVGAGADALEQAFPRVPFVWPDLETGDGIAVVAAEDLPGENAACGQDGPGNRE